MSIAKCFLTLSASKWLFLSMQCDVTFQMTQSEERLSTFHTRVWLFSCMSECVSIKWGFIIIGLFTIWTWKCFYFIMNVFLCFKITRRWKGFITLITREWFFPCVGSHVTIKREGMSKSLWTQGALEWFFSRVTSFVWW